MFPKPKSKSIIWRPIILSWGAAERRQEINFEVYEGPSHSMFERDSEEGKWNEVFS